LKEHTSFYHFPTSSVFIIKYSNAAKHHIMEKEKKLNKTTSLRYTEDMYREIKEYKSRILIPLLNLLIAASLYSYPGVGGRVGESG
jgi:hypothetical protein